MSITVPADDLEFLKRVEALGQEGLTVEQIGEQIGLNPSTLRFRVKDLGFRFTRRIELETNLGGIPLADLIERGDIIPAPEREAVAAEVPA